MYKLLKQEHCDYFIQKQNYRDPTHPYSLA